MLIQEFAFKEDLLAFEKERGDVLEREWRELLNL